MAPIRIFRLAVIAAVFMTLKATGCVAADVRVAVAANFADVAKDIADAFHTATGNTAVLSSGASGQIYNQIVQGAPYDVFLSADHTRPEMLVRQGLGVPASLFTYAIGQLVLWSNRPGVVADGAVLKSGHPGLIAICNPRTAPYGQAAIETMRALSVLDALRPQIVEGQSVAQAYQFVKSGNAGSGFVALSQIRHDEGGSRWIVPATLYTPILQDAVLLKTAADNPVALAFAAFMKSPAIRSLIKSRGYRLPGGD
ncbi:molybdate ABC transporter substrate-binding protein [Gluconacetobacter azotocaptans]|uniref:Molybdate ABC transporter substrate-binding protein n=1 Tax=Gluconacetobacter azotocaptans TaxID=142834 RepID=A0A7W4JT21_9PROT|nr:molybdate ABC transporter substrate-binding protein [Gluconacetobacter azotocaptans]MBB2190383.1 molybdate ABC transporter substrate-binding protein [Gluconacetobacter azotocaptans]GBQ30095.1 molybdate ABC transporter substrate-binding periplasmic protein [Gluconacetobacter azotocaptans DSM 13594]